MLDFNRIQKLIKDNNVFGETAELGGSRVSDAENYNQISLYFDNETNPDLTFQISEEEYLWWEKRLFGKKEEVEESDLSENVPEGWESINSERNRALGFLWKTGSYTFETSTGVKISTKDINDIEIYENKETGEVVVINANGATITSGSEDAKISVYNSVIDKIDTSKGNDEVNIYKSEVDKVYTGRGIDTVNIEDSTVNKVNTGSGNDTVYVSNSTVSDTNTSSNFIWGAFDTAEDTVIINDSSLGKIQTGKGEDNIIANNSFIEILNTGRGGDSVNVNQTAVEKNKGNKKDTIIENSSYLNIDVEKIENIDSQAVIQIDENNSITSGEYVSYLLNQKVGFETEEEYQEYVLLSLTSNYDSMKALFSAQEDDDGCISDGYNWLKEVTGLSITDKDIEDMLIKQEEMIEGLTAAMNGESDMTFEQAYEYYTGTTYSQEKIDKYMEVSNIYSAVIAGCQYDEDYIDKFEEVTGKSIEDVTKEYALCQLDTFGKSSGFEDLVEKYVQDQEEFTDKLSAAISTIGITCIVAGGVISFVFPPAAPVGMALMSAGKYISLGGMYIDNALDLINDSTDKDGLTKEELGNIALETGVETVSYAAGRGIGKLTNGLNSAVTSKLTQQGASKVTSYIAGQATETAVDTVLSLGADYAVAQGQSLIVTGEFMDAEDYWSLDRFLGEGKNQLIGILTGLSSAKVNAYQQGIIKTAQGMILDGDTDGAKIYLKKSGMKMTDTDFDSFVKNVQDVDTQIKTQTADEIKQVVADTDPAGLNEAQFEKYVTLIEQGVSDNVALKAVKLDDEQYAKFEHLSDKGIRSVIAIGASRLDDAQFAKFETLVDKGISSTYALNAAKLDDTQYSKYTALVDRGIDPFYALDALKLDGTQYTKFETLMNEQVPFDCALEAVKLDDIQYARYETLIKMGADSNSALDIAELGDVQYARFEALTGRGIDYRSALKFANFDDTQYVRYETLMSKGVSAWEASMAIELDDTQYTRFETLMNEPIPFDCALKAAKLDDTQYTRYETLIDRGVGTIEALNLVNLDDIQLAKYETLVKKGVWYNLAIEAAKLDDTQYAKYEVLIDKQDSCNYALEAVRLDDTQYSRYVTLIDSGVDSLWALDAAKLNDTQYTKFETLMNKGANSEEAYTAVKIGDVRLMKFEKLLDKGVDSFYALEAVKRLNDTQYTRFETLIENGADSEKALIVAELNDTQYAKFKHLTDKGIMFDYALNATKLDDIKFKRFEDLINKGVNAKIAIELAPVLCDDYSTLTLKEKLNILDNLKRIQGTYVLSDEETRVLNFDTEIEKVQDSLKQAIVTTDVSKADTIKMFKGFFANNDAELENLLSTADFGKYGKEGIPLTYSRTEFLSDLSAELVKLPAETQAEITKKLGIEVIRDGNGNITGYNGIINLSKLSSDGSEGQVLELANKFIRENSVSTGDIELDTALNSLIQGMPEFINVIGKQQHGTHDLSVDSHILSVLQNVMSSPEYENLSSSDKFCLKFATVMHDIAKAEGVVDDGHADVSALYARDILNKFGLPDEMKNRIYEIVKNHHWLAAYNKGEISADEVSAMFRRTDDLTAARILAEADLKGVSDEFYETYKSALGDEKQIPVTESLAKINSAGQIFLTNSIIDKSKVPTVEYNGKTYQVINFSELSADTDLQQYGFEPNTTTDNLRLLIHTVNQNSISQNLENVLLLGESANQGFLCASFVSIENKNTYWNNKFGVSLRAENTNIANASSENQGSGCGKGFERFLDVITGKDLISQFRHQVPDSIKKSLGLTDSEYSELYATLQKYSHASQLDNVPTVTVNGKTFTGTQIKEAVTSADDSIINSKNHNELNVYTPQANAVIAKVNTIEEVPQELLDFAEKHNLPIYLLGSN